MTATIHYLRPYHEARLDDIPLIWKLPDEPATGVVIHIPDFGQRKEDVVPILDLIAASGRIAVTLDLVDHGARRSREPQELAAQAADDYARIVWTLTGETVLDIPTVSTWARRRFGDLPLSLEGVGLGGDIALAASRMVTGVEEVTVIGGSPDWTSLLPGFDDAGKSDTRSILMREMLEPLKHPSDFAGQKLHFVTCAGQPRNDAVTAFKAAVLASATGEGGQIVTTTLSRSNAPLDLSDASLWWPHIASSHAA